METKPDATTINDHLQRGGTVIIATHTNAWQFDKRHAGMFKNTANGSCLMRRGKRWDCIDYCAVRFYEER